MRGAGEEKACTIIVASCALIGITAHELICTTIFGKLNVSQLWRDFALFGFLKEHDPQQSALVFKVQVIVTFTSNRPDL